jgi:hypothetical protein
MGLDEPSVIDRPLALGDPHTPRRRRGRGRPHLRPAVDPRRGRRGTVASGPKVPPADSKVEPLPVQTAIRSAQKQSILASPTAFRDSGGGRRFE